MGQSGTPKQQCWNGRKDFQCQIFQKYKRPVRFPWGFLVTALWRILKTWTNIYRLWPIFQKSTCDEYPTIFLIMESLIKSSALLGLISRSLSIPQNFLFNYFFFDLINIFIYRKWAGQSRFNWRSLLLFLSSLPLTVMQGDNKMRPLPTQLPS